jgi:hypothetical protein
LRFFLCHLLESGFRLGAGIVQGTRPARLVRHD